MKSMLFSILAFGCLIAPAFAEPSYNDSAYRYSSEEPDKNSTKTWLSFKSAQRGDEIRDEYVIAGDRLSRSYRIIAFYEGGDRDNIKILNGRDKVLALYQLYPNQVAIRKTRKYINVFFLFDDFDLGHFIFSRIENGKVSSYDCHYPKNQAKRSIRKFLGDITLRDINRNFYNCRNG